MSDAWIRELADALGVQPPTTEETGKLLAAARDVAHGVERRITPVSAFVLGAAVERRVAGGAARSEALHGCLATLEGLIPDEEPNEVP
jgi:hypothetical protein